MTSNKARGTGPELVLAKLLRKKIVDNSLPGRPDFVYSKARVAVFIHGCWWHGCSEHYRSPKTHPAFWRRKLERNRERDRLDRTALESMGWKVLEVWEHEVKRDPRAVAASIQLLSASRSASLQVRRTASPNEQEVSTRSKLARLEP
ncbi:MAG: very short patch repair endonuclease [Thaumarchaeota archaeon]|nr:very short patch repair endonuclease [Nitrososphaerota archaeon]